MHLTDRIDFQITPYCSVEFFSLPSGERRVGKVSALLACGLPKNYLSRLYARSPEDSKLLKAFGYTGQVLMAEDLRGTNIVHAETLSLDDFKALIAFAALHADKAPAKRLAAVLIATGIDSLSAVVKASFDQLAA